MKTEYTPTKFGEFNTAHFYLDSSSLDLYSIELFHLIPFTPVEHSQAGVSISLSLALSGSYSYDVPSHYGNMPAYIFHLGGKDPGE